jgi:CcmD family protein
MLFQQGPANTLGYMIAGYAVIFGVIGIYVVSLVIRRRNLQRDIEMLEDSQKKAQ